MTKQKATLNTYKLDCTGCKACAADYQADNLKHAIARLIGVSKIKVDGVTGKVVIEFDDTKISLSKITQRMEKLGYHVEVVSTEEDK
ncbi:MAG TPA: heavy-metal-associated domain-containing protein [Candidatus Sulfotelmatobacter sp.]|nr:heavy-metal-associated domain-containing protein [Candidatus Sulfotelmatobacter sp.]